MILDLDVCAAFHRRTADSRGSAAATAAARTLPEVVISEAHLAPATRAPTVAPLLDPVHEVYEALVLGTRDYVDKVGFEVQQFDVTAQAVPVVFNTAPLPTQATVLLVTLK